MLTFPSPPVTAHELAELGTHDGRLELIDGTIVLRPWPKPLHSRVARRLARDLSRAAAPPLRVVERRRVVVGSRTLLVPDLAVVAGTDSSPEPLLVVEISDPSKRRFDRLKLDLYRERGVASCWLVDPGQPSQPGQPSIEAYDLVDDAYVRTATAVAGLPLDVVRPFRVTIVPTSLVDPPGPGDPVPQTRPVLRRGRPRR
jgi:Uma2 family endonuclease